MSRGIPACVCTCSQICPPLPPVPCPDTVFWRCLLRWDRFDFALVTAALLDVLTSLTPLGSFVNPSILRALRIARLARALRAARVGSSMRSLLTTATVAAPALLNVLLVLLMLLSSFAVLATHLFGAILEGETIEASHRNFRSFGSSLLVLFESATGETWSGLMHDCERADCSLHGQRGCSPWAAVPFFLVFMAVAAFVIINVVVAIIIETHAEVENERLDISVRRPPNPRHAAHTSAPQAAQF